MLNRSNLDKSFHENGAGLAASNHGSFRVSNVSRYSSHSATEIGIANSAEREVKLVTALGGKRLGSHIASNSCGQLIYFTQAMPIDCGEKAG